MKDKKKAESKTIFDGGELKVAYCEDEVAGENRIREDPAASLIEEGGQEMLQDMAAFMRVLAAELYDYDPEKEDASSLLGVFSLRPDMSFRFDLYSVEEGMKEHPDADDGCRELEKEETLEKRDTKEGTTVRGSDEEKAGGGEPACNDKSEDGKEAGNKEEAKGSFRFTDVEEVLALADTVKALVQDMVKDMDYLSGLLYASRQVVLLSDRGGLKKKQRNRILDRYCANAADIVGRKWGSLKIND